MSETSDVEQAVIVVDDAGIGEHDGHEFGQGEAVLYTYGPDADALFDLIRPLMTAYGPAPGSHAIKRYGAAADPSVMETAVHLGPP